MKKPHIIIGSIGGHGLAGLCSLPIAIIICDTRPKSLPADGVIEIGGSSTFPELPPMELLLNQAYQEECIRPEIICGKGKKIQNYNPKTKQTRIPRYPQSNFHRR